MALRHGTWVSQETPGIGVTSPLDARLAMAGMLVKDSTGKARSGVFYDGTTNIVSGTAGMSYQIARAVFVQARSVADGAIVFANDGTINVPTTAAPAANSRIDVVYVWHRDFVTDGQNSDPLAGVVQGAASPTPVAPTIPDGAVELARVTVTANATATNGLVITQTAQYTAAAGGVVPFRTKAEMDAVTTVPVGTEARVLADGTRYNRAAAAWVPTTGALGFAEVTEQALAPSTWGDLLTVTAQSGGGPVTVDWDAFAFNGASGADRTLSYRVLCDGTQVGPTVGHFNILLSGSPRVAAGYKHRHTPAAGSHTWKLQAIASAGISVYVERAAMSVEAK